MAENLTCPTCGHDGPDEFSWVDYGVYEAECGDEWHDRFGDGETIVGVQIAGPS